MAFALLHPTSVTRCLEHTVLYLIKLPVRRSLPGGAQGADSHERRRIVIQVRYHLPRSPCLMRILRQDIYYLPYRVLLKGSYFCDHLTLSRGGEIFGLPRSEET